MNRIYVPKPEYRENSKIEKTLELLALKGIDCIKIKNPEHKVDKTVFYPINMIEDENFLNDIEECGGNIFTDDNMEIEIGYMSGKKIMTHNPTLKLKHGQVYNVINIGYVSDRNLLYFAR